ncbi:CooT family nickel-binding protein [Candidatus Bathyarchaeota archaeon]|jgi:predicted RNA-binding protein|nr:CooT family nickel-binding protein [Candidatus Bathyarchaeota archaeon]
MCEFTVYLNGEKVLEDVVSALADGKDIVVRDIVGASRRLNNARITEVNVLTTKLHLTS